jgi:hypothetical protein
MDPGLSEPALISGGKRLRVEGKPDEEDLEALPVGRMGYVTKVSAVATFVCDRQASPVNGAFCMWDDERKSTGLLGR